MESPLDFFRKFLSDDMLDLLVEMTNLYSVQKTGTSVNTNKKEMEQLIGMFFHMGLAKMPGNRCYWETGTRYDPVANVMSRNRFQKLISSIHFVDNITADQGSTDKLWKIRPWLTKFREVCLQVVPEEKNSIDEMMIPFKGKFSKIKQYMKGKPHPRGIKVWVRASSSGMLCDFEVYQGSGGQTQKTEFGVAADVVLRLSSTLPKASAGNQPLNYKIFADNFFTSMSLLGKLRSDGLHYVGTVRPNRIPGAKLMSESELKKKGTRFNGPMCRRNQKHCCCPMVRYQSG